MLNAGTELQDGNVNKDEAWWKKTLGVLDKFKYLDVPIEMAAEVVFDPLAMITGKDLSWVRGTAERKPFEAWGAMFGDDVSERTGFGEFMDRMNIAADAFEKRPLWAQVGLMGVQMAASFGAAGYARGIAAGVKAGTRLTGMSARAGAMVLDPWEIGFHGLKYGYRGTKKGISIAYNTLADDGSSRIIQAVNSNIRGQQAAIDAVFGNNQASFTVNRPTLKDTSRLSPREILAGRLSLGWIPRVVGGAGDEPLQPIEKAFVEHRAAGWLLGKGTRELADEVGWGASEGSYVQPFAFRANEQSLYG